MPINYFYSFEEFYQNVEALEKLRSWKFTVAFGAEANSAKSAKVAEYFFETYSDRSEAAQKSMCFMQIHEYIATHEKLLSARKQPAPQSTQGAADERRSLFRAVHLIFTHRGLGKPAEKIHPKRVTDLVLALDKLDRPRRWFSR